MTKAAVINFVQSSYAMLSLGAVEEEGIKNTAHQVGYFLYEGEEYKKLSEEEINLWQRLELILPEKQKKAKKAKEPRKIRITSEARAREVCNDEQSIPSFIELMKAMVRLRDEASLLISDHAVISIAIKNKNPKSKKSESEAEVDTPENEVVNNNEVEEVEEPKNEIEEDEFSDLTADDFS